MKPTQRKRQFIRLRAQGYSYDRIAKQLHISKATCSAWQQELSAEVTRMKHDELEELYHQYGMAKTERIKQLGSTLGKLNDALANVDLSMVKPDVLLRMKLEYMAALRAEYSQQANVQLKDGTTASVLQAYLDLLRRVQNGSADEAQVRAELAVMDKLRQAQNAADIDIFGDFAGLT